MDFVVKTSPKICLREHCRCTTHTYSLGHSFRESYLDYMDSAAHSVDFEWLVWEKNENYLIHGRKEGVPSMYEHQSNGYDEACEHVLVSRIFLMW